MSLPRVWRGEGRPVRKRVKARGLDRSGISLRREVPDLAHPRALARFLTGLPSPRQTRGKLKSHPLFGTFAHVPFAEVLRRVEEGGREPAVQDSRKG